MSETYPPVAGGLPVRSRLARQRFVVLLTVLATNAALAAGWVLVVARDTAGLDEGSADLLWLGMLALGIGLVTVSTVAGLVAGFLITTRSRRWRSGAVGMPRAIWTGIIATILGLIPVVLVYLGVIVIDVLNQLYEALQAESAA